MRIYIPNLIRGTYFIFFSLIVFFVFGFHLTSFTQAHESTDAHTVVIHVNETGFTPAAITIEPGTTVIFENTGEEGHWPASDSHPSHTLFDGTDVEEHCTPNHTPTFDACGPIAPTESWSFAFEKTGTFGYHDHLWPHLEGQITVGDTGNESADVSIFTRIWDFLQSIFEKISSFFFTSKKDLTLNTGNTKNDFFENLKNKYQALVTESDPREAIATLRDESARDGNVSALCHDVLHEIGHSAYEKYGSFKEAVRFQSDFCNSGYVHGIFEAYFASTDDALTGVAQQCDEYASFGGRAFDLWQCHHGVGHGFMYLTGGDLDESLALCQSSLQRDAATSCQNGVYMELFNLEVLAKEASFIDPENPFSPCQSRDTAKADCYLYVPTYLSQTKGLDFPTILNECAKVETEYRLNCVHGVGSEVIKRNMDEPDSVFALCRDAGSSPEQQSCVIGVVGMYMNQKGSYEAGKELCDKAPSHFRSMCNTAADSRELFFQ